MSIEVTKFKGYDKGPLRGFADIKLVKLGLELKGFRIFHKEGRFWATPPSSEYENAQGEKKYAWNVFFSDNDKQKAFMKNVTEAILSYCKANQVNLLSPPPQSTQATHMQASVHQSPMPQQAYQEDDNELPF